MDTSGTMDDPLNDTPTLPELSFDDLLESPVKKAAESCSDDPLDLDYDRNEREEQTLNTPKPKKPPTTIGASSMARREEKGMASTSTMKTTPLIKINDPKIVTITTSATKTTSTPILLNSKNYLPKIGKVGGQFVKIAPKTPQTIATTAATTTTVGPTLVGGKTVKTPNGQLIYIKSTAGMSAVRLQSSSSSSSSSTTTTTTSSSSATGTTATHANTTRTKSNATSGNKTVAIQVLRSSDGSTRLPLKPATSAAGVTTTTANELTLSPSMANQLAGKKIISIKAPLKTVSASPTTPTTAATATSVVPVTKTSSGKIVVQGANGKQIFVSNQHLLKLPTQNKPLTPGGSNNTTSPSTSTAATSSSASTTPTTSGHMHTIQIPGKSGMQLVRVLNSKFSGGATTSTSTATSSTTPVAITGASSLSGTTPTSSIKILNSVPQKFTVVRPAAGLNTKFLLTQSPKKDGTGGTTTTFNPLTSKVQKAIVTVPTIRPIEENKRSPITQLLTKSGSSSAPSTSSLSLVGKHKISEINSQIKRFATVTGPTEAKRTATGAHVVVMPRSMLRSALPPSLQPRPGYIERISIQGASHIYPSQLKRLQSPQKLYSVLKGQPQTPTTSHAELKSLIICGQAKALMVQQQQHKTLEMKMHEQQQQQEIRKLQQQATQLAVAAKFVPMKIKQEKVEDVKPQPLLDMEAGGVVRRKHCNCSKSQCLKLYCDCFANGEFCQDCTCRDCFNSLQYEDERQRAIKTCLERNPSAFKPKITSARDQSDMRLHNKGCNCKRSGCLKNYCECYEAKIPCSSNCKCVGCRNIEDRPDLDMDPIDPKIMATIANASASTSSSLTNAGQHRSYERIKNSEKIQKEAAKASLNLNSELNAAGGGGGSSSASCSNSIAGGPPADKPQCNFITQDVIDATIQCMISQGDECEKSGLPAYQTEKMIMEELGRCLVEIIDFSIRNTDTSYTQD